MGKKKKGSSANAGYRIRKNPSTGATEQVPGTRAGRNRTRLPFGHPLRTHDINPVLSYKKRARNPKKEHAEE